MTLNGQVGSIAVPGNLTINGGTVTMNTNAGQIVPTSNVALSDGAVLTLTGSNVLNSVSFAGIGGTTQTSVNINGGLLTLSASNAITAQNDNTAMTPLISGGSLAFTSATPTINTFGLSVNSLLISAPIISSSGALNVTGSGAVVFSATGSTFNNGVNLKSGSIIVAADSTPNTVGATVTSGPLGSGTLTTSSGATILSAAGNQNLSNAVVINGNLNFGGVSSANNVTLNGPVTLSSGTVTVNSPMVSTLISGPLSGSSLTKAGPGSLFLSNTGNSQAGVTINNGTVGAYAITASGASYGSPLGVGPVTLNGGRLTLQGQFQNQGLQVQIYNAAATAANYNTLSALQAYQASTAGTLALSTGVTALTTMNGKADLNFSSNNYAASALFGTAGATTANYGFAGTTNFQAVFSGYVYLPTPGQYSFNTTSDDGSMLWLDGQNTAVVNSNNSQGATTRAGIYENTAAGWHQITMGYYQGTGGEGFLPQIISPNGSAVTISNSILATSPSASQSYANPVNVTANSIIDVSNSLAASMGSLAIGSNTLTLTTAGSAATLTLGAVALGGSATFSPNANTTLILGALNDIGTAQTITITNSGTVTLNQAATSLIGGTQFNILSGTLNPTAAGAMGTLAQVSVSNGGLLNLGASQTIGTLSGSGSVAMNTNSLTVGSTNNLSSTFAGVISGGTASGLLVGGTGGLTLTGSNTFSGPTTISSGTLTIGGAGVLNGGTYSGAISNSGALVVNTSSNQTYGGAISGSGPLYQLGSGTLTLSSSASSYTGGTTISGGVLQLGNSAALGAQIGSLAVVTGGTLDLHGYSPTVGALTGNASAFIADLAPSSTSTLTTNTAANTTFAGTIFNSGAPINLVKTGTGALALTGTSSYTGTTSVNQGTLAFTTIYNKVGGNFSLGAGTGTINMGSAGFATLQFIGDASKDGGTYRVINLQGTAAIDSSGFDSQNGGNTFVLNGKPNSVTVSGMGQNLVLTGTAGYNGGGEVGTAMNLGTGAVTKSGPGTWTFDVANSYTGGTNVNAGLLFSAANGALGTGPVSVNGGTLDVLDWHADHRCAHHGRPGHAESVAHQYVDEHRRGQFQRHAVLPEQHQRDRGPDELHVLQRQLLEYPEPADGLQTVVHRDRARPCAGHECDHVQPGHFDEGVGAPRGRFDDGHGHNHQCGDRPAGYS